MRPLLALALALCFCCDSNLNAQSGTPRPAFQTGFTNPDFEITFEFSPKNNYLIGFDGNGEFVLWDLHSSRQIKHIMPHQSESPALFYFPDFDFSQDEKLILIQDITNGTYALYNVQLDSVQYTFTPPDVDKGERYTHAKFSADQQSVLLISNAPGKNTPCFFRIFSVDGTLKKTCQTNLPGVLDDYGAVGLGVKLFARRAMKLINKTTKIFVAAVSPDLGDVYFFTPSQKLGHINLAKAKNNSSISEQELSLLKLPGMPSIDRLVVSGDELIAKREQFRIRQKDNDLLIDTLYILDRTSMSLKKKIAANYPSLADDQRSNGVTSKIVTLNANGKLYFDTETDAATLKRKIVAKQVQSGQKVFDMPVGTPIFWYSKSDYEATTTNGGAIVAISADGTLVAENSREIVIHDVVNKTVKNQFSAVFGQLKLNQPLFLDQHRVLIPKTYNDGFVLSLKDGNIERLKRTIDCQDTTRRGVNVLYTVDPTAMIGLQSAAVDAAAKKFAITQYIPNSLCEDGYVKTIEVFNTESLQSESSFKYPDREFTYHFNMVPGNSKKFLVNYKLIDFNKAEAPSITELKVISKKDTFVAVNPVYLPTTQTIFTVMGTRSKSGNPDIIFAHYSLDGKLVKSFRHTRKKNETEFQTYVYEAQLSPDSTRLLFALQDGTIGIFDIINMKIIRLFKHNEKPILSIGDEHYNFYALSGCFIDNNRFVTAGNDFKVIIWSTEKETPERVLALPEGVQMLGLTVSPDKRHVVGTDISKNIRFINLETGQIDLTFSAFNYENYALLTKDGYYMANKKSTSNFNFLYNGRAYEFSQFDVRLNRPDKVLEQMGYVSADQIGWYKKAYEKRIKKLGYTLAQVEGNSRISIPEISITGLSEQRNVTTVSDLSFTLTASDKQFPMSRLHVTVNGVPIYGTKGLSIKQSAPGVIKLPVKVPLTYGQNQLSISAANNQGIESIREFVTITRKEEPVKPDLYLISIGAATYVEKSKNLKYAAKDAGDIQNLFNDRKTEFGLIVKQSLTNEKVTRAGILKLKDQLRKSKPNDQVVVFYAGHGVLDKQLNYFLGTYDMDFANPGNKGIAYEELEDLLDSIPARNKVLLIDACHSGEVDKESVAEDANASTSTAKKIFRNDGIKSYKEVSVGLANSFQLMRSLFPDLRRSSGASIISAAGATEYAVEGDQWKNGVFTYCLLSGLKEKKADMDKDGKIYLTELQEYLQATVKELTRGQQQPTSRYENLANNFRVW